eukprot:TRINITY_DN10154_c0_g1_i1.p1 TRINITY_DN10154_c0_g1~~TRINITY_DN10154_c0_g1_i1.p1  ORF type:complete len:141 (+),score=7.94 TRINITY_DN10154_c0_g1_i1:40-462(+)
MECVFVAALLPNPLANPARLIKYSSYFDIEIGPYSHRLCWKSSTGRQVLCRKKEANKRYELYKVIDVTPPPTNLGTRSFPSNMHCGESITIEDKPYIISSVTHRYQLRRGKYEPSEKRLDVQSAGRYLVNKYLETLMEET